MISVYWENLSIFDGFILALGAFLFFVQIVFVVALWCHRKFATQEGSAWRDSFAGVCEMFPLMGLLGTVLGLLNTFGAMGSDLGQVQMILQKFAPALTTTISGILCMLPNLMINMIYSVLLKKEVKDKEVEGA